MSREIRRRLRRKGLDARQIKVYAHLHSHCFNGPVCWPSQALIGQRCGMSRQLVNQVCQELRDHGVIEWTHEHRRGSQRPCNVYRLRYWTRPKRAGTLRVLRRLNACDQGLPDRKGQPSRALTPERDERHRDQPPGKGHCSLGADVHGKAKAGQATRSAGHEGRTGIRRSSMEQRRRHLQAADLTEQPLLEEIARKDEIIRKYAISETKNGEEIAGLHNALRAAGKEITRLRRDLTRQANESARAEQIEKVVEHWRYRRPKASSAFGKPGSRSYQVIEKALGLMADDEKGAVVACCEAIDGLHLAPWQEYDQRFARPGGPKRVLRNGVEHALGDEQRIERCRSILRKARGLGAERAWEQYMAVGEVERAWADEVLDLLREQPVPRERFAYVDGIRTRVDA